MARDARKTNGKCACGSHYPAGRCPDCDDLNPQQLAQFRGQDVSLVLTTFKPLVEPKKEGK